MMIVDEGITHLGQNWAPNRWRGTRDDDQR
jgi:hypothetical protein